jgi:large subunit ribosomal protein L21
MFAVIETGGKQYRVAQNDIVTVERLAGEPGETVEFDRVLMMGSGEDLSVGAPVLDGARVVAEVVDQTRSRKVLIFKKKRRKHHRRQGGHRQEHTVLRITDILAQGAKPAAAAKKSPAKKAAAKKAAPEADTQED